jgi:hypothetical protein
LGGHQDGSQASSVGIRALEESAGAVAGAVGGSAAIKTNAIAKAKTVMAVFKFFSIGDPAAKG